MTPLTEPEATSLTRHQPLVTAREPTQPSPLVDNRPNLHLQAHHSSLRTIHPIHYSMPASALIDLPRCHNTERLPSRVQQEADSATSMSTLKAAKLPIHETSRLQVAQVLPKLGHPGYATILPRLMLIERSQARWLAMAASAPQTALRRSAHRARYRASQVTLARLPPAVCP